MILNRVAIACTAGVVALLPGACSDEPEAKTAIEFQVSGEPEEIAVYDALANAYMEEHPDVTVEVIESAEKSDHLARLSTSFAAGKPPDAFLLNFREYSQFAARGALEPAGPLVEEAGVNFDDYYEAPLEAFTYDDALQCMPQNISSLAVYYNRGVFEKLSVEEPPKEWSWEEFQQTAKQLTRGDVDGVGFEPSIIRLAPFVWSNGGELVDDVDAPQHFTLENTEDKQALQFLLDLVRNDKVVPTEEEVAAQDLETRFETGKLGMFLSSRVDTPRFREVSGLDFDVAPLPVADEPSNILHSDAYCMARDSDEKEEAAAFITYAVSEQGQILTARGGRTVPSLKSVSTSPAFLDPTQAPSRAQVWIDAIPHLQRTPVITTWPEIEDRTEEVLTSAFYDDMSTEEAVEQIDEQADPLFQAGH